MNRYRSHDSNGAGYPPDARHNPPRIGRHLIARGRDAVDIALTAALGTANLTQFIVWTDETRAQAAVRASRCCGRKGTAPLTPSSP